MQLRFFLFFFFEEWLCFVRLRLAGAFFVTESGDVNNAIVQNCAEDKKSESGNLDERILCPRFSVLACNSIVNEEIDRPDDDRSASVDECAVNTRHVFSHRKTKEVVERNRGKIQQAKDEQRSVGEHLNDRIK